MGLTLPQTFWDLLQKSKKVLIIFGQKSNADAIASALACQQILTKNKISAEIAAQNFSPPEKLRFLPRLNEIQPQLNHLKKFVISLDISRAKIEEFSYNIADNKLNINISPKSGAFSDQDISSSNSDYRYDLIITIDTPDLEHLGTLYDENTDFFYNTPIINIDHHAENEQYGQINLVDLNATSSSEIIFSIFKKLQPEAIDEPVATCLLTGIMTETKGFRGSHITPQLLEVVSQLLAAGAKREEIVEHLYRTKSIETLKLWGKTLANLKHEPEIGLVWATLSAQDLASHPHNEDQLREVVEELINNSPEAKIICLLYESPDNVTRCLASTDKGIDALQVTQNFRPTGTHNSAEFALENTSLKEASEKVLQEIKKRMVVA